MIPGIVASHKYVTGDTDPYFSSVVLGMHMNGADSGTTFTDIKSHSVSVFGGAQTKTATKKFGTASAYFDGSGDYLTVADSADWDFGTSDFTIEGFFRADSIASTYQIMLARQDATSTNMALQIRTSDTNKIQAIVRSSGSGTAYSLTGTTTLSSTTFYYISLTRGSGVFRLHLDGVQEATLTQTLTLDGSALLYFARGYDGTSQYAGYLDDWRITKGVARYTASTYTVQTAEFPNS
jgi:hypothetical protein